MDLKFWAWNGLKSGQNPKDNVIAIDGKPANVLQLNTNHVFTFEGKAINGVKSSFRTAVKNAEIEDLEKRLKKMENQIVELTSIDYEERGQIVLKDIPYGQAKKEIKEYFSKHHGEIIDAADIQEALNIDISMAIEILDDLECEGKIKTR